MRLFRRPRSIARRGLPVGKRHLLAARYLYLMYDTEEEYQVVVDGLTAELALDPVNAIALHNRATAYAEMSEPRLAMADLNRAAELAPDQAFPFERRGMLKANLGDFEGAIADFSTAIENAPGQWSLYGRRADAAAKLGRDADAEEDQRVFVEMRDADPMWHRQFEPPTGAQAAPDHERTTT